MIPLVQGLGRFDWHLINEDARFAALNQEQTSSLHESTRLADRLTLSYFWVLAAYELCSHARREDACALQKLPQVAGASLMHFARSALDASSHRFRSRWSRQRTMTAK
jgi:hypothetical protein